MKKLGLIGGTGPESTVIYYRELNRILYEKTNGTQYPEIAIESIDMEKGVVYMEKEDYAGLADYLLERLGNLEKSGAQLLALTAGTMHAVYPLLKERVHKPLISIPETAAAYAAKQGYKKVGLLGTIFTMRKDYMKTPFIERRIDVIVPCEEDKQKVSSIIYKELERGVVKESSRDTLLSVIGNMMRRDGVEAIVLGCTELPLALNADNCPVPCLDCMQLHIDALAALALSDAE